MALSYEPAAELMKRLLEDRVVSRIWARDRSVWNAEPGSAAARSISTRLGWLDVGETMSPHVARVEELGGAARAEGITSVCLLGMGGSSLCAEVLQSVLGTADGFPRLQVLDTTDEATIRAASERVDPGRTWFVVASKSGSTIEVSSLERYFWERTQSALGHAAGRQFVAITDPDTALDALARERGYRDTFLNPADIGGRFSALSLFGLVPTALIGQSARDLLSAGTAMADGCRQENGTNAGLELGAYIAGTTATGRDKLTLVLPPSLERLGLWIEQLVAESTGKHGKGTLPVVDEPIGALEDYGQDRAFVAITTDVDGPDKDALAVLEAAGHPVLRLTIRVDGLGAEFFRWEFATAVAGAALGINPFDEPNVSEAKEKTRTLLASSAEVRAVPGDAPNVEDDGVAIHTKASAGSAPREVVRAALDDLDPGDYVAFLSYLPPDQALEETLAKIRRAIRRRTRAATTYGVGPRYLHSTGQYHKGGPNTVLAFVLTAEDGTETPIPGAGYTFAVLKRAQAVGDFQTLQAHGRRVIRLHLKNADHARTLERLFSEF